MPLTRFSALGPGGDIPGKFAELASQYSDCSSAKKGGDLGPFGRGQMQSSFEVGTYALKVGELSDGNNPCNNPS